MQITIFKVLLTNIFIISNRYGTKLQMILDPMTRSMKIALPKYFSDPYRINNTITSALKNANKEILFLISTKEMFLRIKIQIYEIVQIIKERNINTRILIATSNELQDFAYDLDKYPTINFQRLYRSASKNSALLIKDSENFLDLEFRNDANISNGANENLVYSNKEERVQTYLALFENYWILPLIHENIPNR